jgi:hypothetical protein
MSQEFQKISRTLNILMHYLKYELFRKIQLNPNLSGSRTFLNENKEIACLTTG